jgi:molecular chaperone IbpA
MSKDLYDLLDDLEAIFQHPSILGFTPLVNELRSVVAGSQKYPPRNVIRTDENTWVLEVALAGFSAHDISIEEYGGYLYISGRSSLAERAGQDYAHHGIARRDFSISMKLGEHINVVGEPIMQHGILVVWLEREIPEAQKRRSFAVKAINEDGSELASREPVVDSTAVTEG